MPLAEPLLQEIEREAATTRRVLERVPESKLGWKPHEKSMTLGQLATHVATTPGGVAKMITSDTTDASAIKIPDVAGSGTELLAKFDESLAEAKRVLSGLDDAALMSNWSLVRDGKPILTLPKMAVVRMIAMNHVYHHRGQLSVYLRMLDVPLPSIYGPSADENPFA